MCDTKEIPNTKTIVVENGSCMMRAGIAGDDVPTVEFPSVVGRLGKPPRDSHETSQNIFIGNDVRYNLESTSLNTKYPIDHGVVMNWDDMEMIWQDIFDNQLHIETQVHPILLTEAPLTPKVSREKMIQVMFETFEFPAMFVAVNSVLSLYSSGSTTGMVFDSGDCVSYSVPIYEGHTIHNAIGYLHLAGRDLTDFMWKTLRDDCQFRSQPFPKNRGMTEAEVQRKISHEIKEMHCYVALDFDKEMEMFTEKERHMRYYEIPGGKMISVSEERFRIPEALFQPTLIGMDSCGIHEFTYNKILKCDSDLQKDMFGNIVLSGGNTLFSGMAERLQKEMTTLAPPETNIKVRPPPKGKDSVWIGGSILASLSTFPEMCINKEEYDESGPTIIHRKCF